MSTFYEPASPPADPIAAVRACIEADRPALLLGRDALPTPFFDLRTGVAGEVAQRLALFGIRMAAVVPDLDAQPAAFQAFAREAHRGRQIRFALTREAAAAWLDPEPNA